MKEMWDLAVDFSEKAKTRGNQLPSASIKERLEAIDEDMKSLNKDEFINKLQNFYGTGMETIETVPTALAVIKMSNGNPLVSARICAELGGDTDTIGAIATAVCGAMNPIEDATITAKLEEVNEIDFDIIATNLKPFAQLQNAV